MQQWQNQGACSGKCASESSHHAEVSTDTRSVHSCVILSIFLLVKLSTVLQALPTAHLSVSCLRHDWAYSSCTLYSETVTKTVTKSLISSCFEHTVFLIILALWAKPRVVAVSRAQAAARLTLATITVLALPPRQSCTPSAMPTQPHQDTWTVYKHSYTCVLQHFCLDKSLHSTAKIARKKASQIV